MNIKIGFIKLGNHSVAHALRGSVLPLVATMALSAVFCPITFAAGAFDNASIASQGLALGIDGLPDGTTGAGPVITFQHVIGSGADRILLVGTVVEGPGAEADGWPTVLSSVTYNTVAMIEVDSVLADITTGMRVTLHYLLNADLPASGSHNVVVTYSSEDMISVTAAAISLENFVQQAPEAMVTGSGATSPISADITTLTPNAWLVNIVGAGDEVSSFTSSSGMTIRDTEKIGTQDTAIATRVIATPGLQSISWAYPTPNRMAQVIAAFEEIPDPPPIFSILPSGGVREIGASHTFEVALANPVGSLTHVWKKDGAQVGPDAATYTLTDLQISDSGQYLVEVTDDTGTYITNAVSLTVVEELPAAGSWALVFVAALLLLSGIYLVRRRVARR